MVHTTHLWWLGAWFIIAIPTLTCIFPVFCLFPQTVPTTDPILQSRTAAQAHGLAPAPREDAADSEDEGFAMENGHL